MPIDIYQGSPLADILEEMSRNITTFGGPEVRVWSRGNSYDLSILKLAYARTGKPLPYSYWNERDVRTWLEGCQFKSPRKNKHDALDDAINQALDVIEATAAVPASSASPTTAGHSQLSENPVPPLPTLA